MTLNGLYCADEP